MTPGGGIDPGETETEAAVREVREETGFDLDPPACWARSPGATWSTATPTR